MTGILEQLNLESLIKKEDGYSTYIAIQKSEG